MRKPGIIIVMAFALACTATSLAQAAVSKPAGDWSQGYLEPLALMSFLAGVTSRVRLGTSVLVIPYRNPVVTAKMLATLAMLAMLSQIFHTVYEGIAARGVSTLLRLGGD